MNNIPYYHYEAANDKWIVEEVFKYNKNGFFIECGAYDGITNSACYTLEKNLNWNGICIEGNSDLFQKARIIRNNVLYNALGDCDGKLVNFYECNGDGLSGVNEFLDEKAKIYAAGHIHLHTTHGAKRITQIEMKTLKSILDEQKAPSTIEYAAFDMEGAEYPVLSKFLSEKENKYKILALSIEGDKCDDLMIQNGYIQVKNKFNLNAPYEHYFIHNSIYNNIYE